MKWIACSSVRVSIYERTSLVVSRTENALHSQMLLATVGDCWRLLVCILNALTYKINWSLCLFSSASGLRLEALERTYLRVQRMKTHFGDRAFSAAGPWCWNSLPPVIRLADSVDSFKAQLKTRLFAKACQMQLLVRRPCCGMAALLRLVA